MKKLVVLIVCHCLFHITFAIALCATLSLPFGRGTSSFANNLFRKVNFNWCLRIMILCLTYFQFNTSSAQVLLTGRFTIGGASSEAANSMVQTNDTGFVFAGYTNSFGAGNADVYVVKMSKAGVLEWTRTVGGSGNDYGKSITQTLDSGYAIAGSTASFGAGLNDVYVVKLDKDGALIWTRTIGGGFGNEFAYSIQQTSDSGYIVTGSTYSYQPVGGAFTNNVYVIKLDKTGTLKWTQVIGGDGEDYGYSIIQTTDGGYILAGKTNTAAFVTGAYDVYVVKLNSTGTIQWTQTIGGAASDYGYYIKQTSDGGYIVAGNTNSFGSGGGVEIYIIKMDNVGTVQWTRTVGTGNQDFGSSVVQTTDGGYIVGGYTGVALLYNFCLVRLNSDGTLRWAKSYDVAGYAQAFSTIQTKEGGFAIAGVKDVGSNYEIYMIKTDSSGNVEESLCPTSNISSVGSGGSVRSGGSHTTGGGSDVGGTSGSGGAIGTQDCVTLPIELLAFTASPINNEKVLCQWITATEINNDYFTVEKTKDGRQYKFVGQVKGARNSNATLSYQLIDDSPYQGTSYYRLKQTDFDGKYTYSQLVPVNLKGVDIISISPNPAHDEFEYKIGSTEKMTVQVKVVNVLGQIVSNTTEVVEKGITQRSMNVSALSSGTYILELITEHSELRGKQFQIK